MAKLLLWLIWLNRLAIITISAIEPSIRTIRANQLIMVSLYVTVNLTDDRYLNYTGRKKPLTPFIAPLTSNHRHTAMLLWSSPSLGPKLVSENQNNFNSISSYENSTFFAHAGGKLPFHSELVRTDITLRPKSFFSKQPKLTGAKTHKCRSDDGRSFSG